MGSKNEIPLHSLENRDFYAAYAENIALGEISKNHRIDFFAVIWYRANGENQLIDFEPYPVQNNLIYHLSKDQVHSLPEPATDARVIIFSNSFFDRLPEELRLPFLPFNNQGIAVSAEMEPVLEKLFSLILLENETDNESAMLQNYMFAYLSQINRLSHQNGLRSNFHDPRLRKLFTLINKNFRSEKYAPFYAGHLGLTPKRINQIVQDELGYTVTQLIAIYTFVEAKREISQQLKSFKEIAIELGFSSQSYFSRFFKKHTGQTPEQFQEQYFK